MDRYRQKSAYICDNFERNTIYRPPQARPAMSHKIQRNLRACENRPEIEALIIEGTAESGPSKLESQRFLRPHHASPWEIMAQ